MAGGMIVFGDNELPVKLQGPDSVNEDDFLAGSEKLNSAGEEKNLHSCRCPARLPGSCHREGISITKSIRESHVTHLLTAA